jgi:hypothetical protein
VQLRLAQPAPNVDGIGAWIEVRAGDRVQRREITSGGGHVSGSLGWWHFGLGAAETAEARVIWPDGTESDWNRITPNARYVLDRAKGLEPWAAD